MNIYEALALAADKRKLAEELHAEADELEREWLGATSGDVLTPRILVDVVRKIGEATA